MNTGDTVPSSTTNAIQIKKIPYSLQNFKIPENLRFLSILFIIALLSVVPSAMGIPGRWLWLDEILSAVFAANGPWSTLVTVLRFDVHPPLYYIQLSFWMLLSKNDVWLMANSVVWHMIAVVLLGWSARGRYGTSIGLCSAILLAISPAILVYADGVRMYLFIVALIILVWYSQILWIENEGGSIRWILMVLSQSAVANSHTGGLLMLSGCVILGFIMVLSTKKKLLILRWILAETTVLFFSVLPVAVGLLRGVAHLDAPDVSDVISTWVFLTGGKDAGTYIVFFVSISVFLLMLVGSVRDKFIARDALALVFIPILIAIALSYAHKPVWIERLFIPTIPFICLSLARSALGLHDKWIKLRIILLVFIAASWVMISLVVVVPRPKGDGFRLAAEAAKLQARPSDTIIIEGDYNYWCFLWYFIGPNWGDPRQAFVMSPQWESMMNRLPSFTPRLLGLGSSHSNLKFEDVSVVMWDPRTSPPRVTDGDVFLLRMRFSQSVIVPGRHLYSSTQYMQLVLERWISEAP